MKEGIIGNGGIEGRLVGGRAGRLRQKDSTDNTCWEHTYITHTHTRTHTHTTRMHTRTHTHTNNTHLHTRTHYTCAICFGCAVQVVYLSLHKDL